MSHALKHRQRHDQGADEVQRRFRQIFGADPSVFRAPGRVNLIGEHTDYNGGFVMPAAIGFYTYAAVVPAAGTLLTVHSANFGETREFDLTSLPPGRSGHWSDYVIGVAAILQFSGIPLRGASMLISGNVPIGAGLSSSAALEVATALALLSSSGVHLDRPAIAKACQRAESEYTGTRCGIMDQFTACFGQAGNALMLDCRSLEFSLLAIPAEVNIVICDTRVRHALATGEYNHRRAECESSVEYLRRFLPGIRALRDVSLAHLRQYGLELSETAFRRCRHVVSENARVLEAVEALQGGDLKRFGILMYESHTSLREDYEVSCQELDLLVDIARSLPGVLGARMTGGGFGGCTVNLVESGAVREFTTQLAQKYQAATSIRPEIYVCWPVDGAQQV